MSEQAGTTPLNAGPQPWSSDALQYLSEALDEVRDRLGYLLDSQDVGRLAEAGEVLDSLAETVAAGGAQ